MEIGIRVGKTPSRYVTLGLQPYLKENLKEYKKEFESNSGVLCFKERKFLKINIYNDKKI